jgi:hypothetical protein
MMSELFSSIISVPFFAEGYGAYSLLLSKTCVADQKQKSNLNVLTRAQAKESRGAPFRFVPRHVSDMIGFSAQVQTARR